MDAPWATHGLVLSTYELPMGNQWATHRVSMGMYSQIMDLKKYALGRSWVESVPHMGHMWASRAKYHELSMRGALNNLSQI